MADTSWYDETNEPPVGSWFPVNTATGQWGSPGATPSLASSAGMPDVTAPAVMGGTPDQAPLSIGQASGGFAPALGPQPRMQALARADWAGLLTPQPSVWESIARGVGMATPQGRAILQGYDQQQQQGIQNRLALRRQQLLEDQETRQATQSSLDTFLKISQMPNKSMRNVLFDRYVADYQQATGQQLPADMVEAFKKSSLDEGKQMAQLLTPLFRQAGIDPAIGAQMLEEGTDPKRMIDLIDTGLKVKKQGIEEQEIANLGEWRTRLGGGTLGDVSGTTPSAPAPPPAASVSLRPAEPPANAPMPIRMKNPLNIKQGPATQKWIDQGAAVPGDEAQDGGRFLKFQSPSQGVQAAQDLLTGPTYSGLSVDAALKKWSNNGYGAEIVSGVDGQKKIADLSPAELQRTMGAMIKREGGAPARAPDTGAMVAGPGAPSQDAARLQALNQRIQAMDAFLEANVGRGSERTRAAVSQVQKMREEVVRERDQLTEPTRAGVRTQAEARARGGVERELRAETTLAQEFKGETPNLYDTQTGQQLDARMKVKDYETRPQGSTRMLSPAQREQMENLNQAVPIIAQLQTHIDKIYGPGGVLARMTPDDREVITSGTPLSQRLLDQFAQKYPELIQAQRFIDSNAGALARALAGEKGAMAEGDVERARAMLPNLMAAINVWPLSKIGVKLPDTRAVALGTMNSVVDMINARGRTLLGNEQYQHPKLHRYTTADEAQQQTGSPGPTRARPRPQDIAPEGKPAVGLNPNWRPPVTPPPATSPQAPTSGQRALRAMTPAQLRQLPDALARAVIATPGMEQGLSPEQKEALADGLERWERSQARR